MHYVSTRDKSLKLTAAQAIAQGLSRDGGLFLPSETPKISLDFIKELCPLSYPQRAEKIMKLFLEDFTEEELRSYTKAAYSQPGYDCDNAAPLRLTDSSTAFLELWHGPTCAFKDMALQMLPYLLTASLKKTGETKQVCILVATSGDTGKAALEGFKDVPGTKILVFYPSDGVSDVQKLQMQTQQGSNVGVCAVYGNFDDAQNGVKAIFSDEGLRETLADKGYFFSSANSINWGRLLPQVVYYISAYCELLNAKSIKLGDKINFCVPTGNFGNILAGYYALEMGLPVKRLICASNRNKILTDFIETGIYDRNRDFYTTMSPSMDILISSNLERLLYLLSGGNDRLIAGYMKKLSTEGRYEVDKELLTRLQAVFTGGFATEEETSAAIKAMWLDKGYIIDTHTAVALHVLSKYREEIGDGTVSVVVSTASPYKFCDSVLSALGEDAKGSGTELINRLSEVTRTPVPEPLKGLDKREVRFKNTVSKEEMTAAVMEMLKQ
jgi:threonine synthase